MPCRLCISGVQMPLSLARALSVARWRVCYGSRMTDVRPTVGCAALRVLDVAQGWAGPMVSFLLAALGADVLKVEDTRRFDWWRGPHPQDAARLPDGSINPIAHETAHVFNSVNRRKRGVTLDLTTAAGRDALLNLVRISDVVVENFTPHAMHALGLDYRALAAVNPALIMLSMPAFGLDGPEREYIAYGMTIEAISGMTALTGYHDGPPQLLGNAYGDSVSGVNGAVAVMIALRARERSGKGSHIELAQVEAFMPLIGGALVYARQGDDRPHRIGNHHRSVAPHGVYPCQGADAWVALSADTDAVWQALCRAMDAPALAADPRFADVVSRKRHEDALDAVVAQWTGQHDRAVVVATLTRAGVTAEAVQTSPDVLADPRLAGGRGFFTVESREHVGAHPYPGLPFVVEPPLALRESPAPLLGEHSDAVLRSLLGVSETQLRVLHDTHVTGTEPRR